MRPLVCILVVLCLVATIAEAGRGRRRRLRCPATDADDDDGPPANKAKADIDTLEQVNVAWRHGARLPTFPTYPNDPYQNLTLWEDTAGGWASLTVVGRQMHYELGSYLRERYDGWLSKGYDPDEIYVQSSDIERTIMSALSNMAGLWPVTPEDPKSQWNPDVNWQPIPVRVLPIQDDYLIAVGAHCHPADKITGEYSTNSTYAKSINNDPENVKLFEYLTLHTGEPVRNFQEASLIYSYLKAAKTNGFPLPDWAVDHYDKMREFMDIFFSNKVFTPTPESRRMRVGHLLYAWLKNMESRVGISEPFEGSKSRAKMQAYSGHVDTVGPILSALGVEEWDDYPQEPPFASAVIMELHKVDPDQPDMDTDPRNHYVRFFWRNSTDVPPYELEMPDCGFPCRLSTYKAVYRDLFATRAEAVEICATNPEDLGEMHAY